MTDDIDQLTQLALDEIRPTKIRTAMPFTVTEVVETIQALTDIDADPVEVEKAIHSRWGKGVVGFGAGSWVFRDGSPVRSNEIRRE